MFVACRFVEVTALNLAMALACHLAWWHWLPKLRVVVEAFEGLEFVWLSEVYARSS